jgi:hypothetical protein
MFGHVIAKSILNTPKAEWVRRAKALYAVKRVFPVMFKREADARITKRVDEFGTLIDYTVRGDDRTVTFKSINAAIEFLHKAYAKEVHDLIEQETKAMRALIADEEITDEMQAEAQAEDPEMDRKLLAAQDVPAGASLAGAPTKPLDDPTRRPGADPGFIKPLDHERAKAKIERSRRVRLF